MGLTVTLADASNSINRGNFDQLPVLAEAREEALFIVELALLTVFRVAQHFGIEHLVFRVPLYKRHPGYLQWGNPFEPLMLLQALHTLAIESQLEAPARITVFVEASRASKGMPISEDAMSCSSFHEDLEAVSAFLSMVEYLN